VVICMPIVLQTAVDVVRRIPWTTPALFLNHMVIYIFKVGQFAHNATLDIDGRLVERSSCAAADRGPSRARVLGRAAAGLAAR